MTTDAEVFRGWAGDRQLALLRTAVLLTGDHHRAEALVQEALSKVALRWRRLRAGDPEAYARQVIVRHTISRWRERRREVVTDDPHPVDVPDVATAAGRRILLDRALAALTPRQRAVVVLPYNDDLTERETAEALRVSVGTVTSQTRLALRRLRAATELAELLGEDVMTVGRLRELLQERVAELTTTDLATDAWADAGRVRRRRTAGLATGAVAAAAVAGGVVLGGGERDSEPAPPEPSPTSHRSADDEYHGVPVWWGPEVEEETTLPVLADSPLPRTIDLRSTTGPVPTGVRAAALIRDDGVAVLAHDGDLHRLDVSRLDRVADQGGNLYHPLTRESLAPDGRHAFFAQTGSLEVYDFADGSWTTIEVPRWHAESARWVSDTEIYVSGPGREPTGGGTTYDLEGNASPTQVELTPVWDAASDHPWGPQRGDARSYFVPGLEGAGIAVVVRRDGEALLLAVPRGVDGPDDRVSRFQGCCPVVGWLDPDTVLFESRSTEATRILAWRAGTREVSLVAAVRGLYAGASFADLSRP